MKITWYGQSCFKIIAKNTTIVTDPFGKKDIGLKPLRCEAGIVTVSHDHHDHNNVSSLRGTPFVIDGPGEYELKKVAIRGLNSFHDAKEGKERGYNTIFVIETEGMRVCHLGDLGQKELTSEQLDKIGDVDVLMIPVGGVYTIDGEKAVAVINQIEPRIVIPMHYKIPKLKSNIKSADSFLKEIGVKKETVDQLILKKNDLLKDDMRVVVMRVT